MLVVSVVLVVLSLAMLLLLLLLMVAQFDLIERRNAEVRLRQMR